MGADGRGGCGEGNVARVVRLRRDKADSIDGRAKRAKNPRSHRPTKFSTVKNWKNAARLPERIRHRSADGFRSEGDIRLSQIDEACPEPGAGADSAEGTLTVALTSEGGPLRAFDPLSGISVPALTWRKRHRGRARRSLVMRPFNRAARSTCRTVRPPTASAPRNSTIPTRS